MWFSASLLIKASSPSRATDELLWEERIVLIEAACKEDAEAQAMAIGNDANYQYVATSGETIMCTFERIERVFEIGEDLETGTELFCRFLRNSEVESLLTPFED